MPAGPGVRVDTGFGAGDRVPPDYDPLIAKLMVVDVDRATAIARLARALDETVVSGIQTTLPFHRFVARHEGFREGRLSIDWVADEWAPAVESERAKALEAASRAAAAAASAGSSGAAGLVAVGAAVAEGLQPTSWNRDGTVPSGWARDGRVRAVNRWPR
jgi:acetyl/propionyl-CoA carboxylase alpha subunit